MIVITGCDSGIGRSIANHLIKKGYTLVVSYLKENYFEDDANVYALHMDLTNHDHVRYFKQQISKLCHEGHKIEAVIANAGIALGGPVENIPMELYRENFEINFFGAVEIIKACLPDIINNRGRVMVIGSLAGKVALPFLSPYASSKFAIEGFCDSLRREMNPFGVKTILIEPASVATPIWNKSKEQDISYIEEKYIKSLNHFRNNFIEGGNQGLDVEIAGKQIVDFLLLKNPKSRYIIAKNRLTSKLTTMIPSFILDKAVTKMFQMYYGNRGNTNSKDV